MNIQTIVGHYKSNTFVVERDGTVIIIDAGAAVGDVVGALSSRVVPSAVLLTHEHFDHTLHAEEYKKQFGCPVIAPESETPITIGNIVVQPMLCAGHSEKSVCYLIENQLFTGDVLFRHTIGRTDLMQQNGETVLATPEIQRENERKMQATLCKLHNVKFETAHHGHFRPSTYEQQQQNIKKFIK